jgi:thiol-disulfide isomerase/thioredoxin
MHLSTFARLLIVAALMAISTSVRAVTLDEVSGLIGDARLVDGTARTVERLEGRVVVVTTFASWCPPCRDEFVHLNRLVAATSRDDVAIVAVNLFENWGGQNNAGRMARFLARTDPKFPVIRGSEALRVKLGPIERIPSVVVFDRSGTEIWRFVHKRGSAKTHATLADLKQVLTAAQVRFR